MPVHQPHPKCPGCSRALYKAMDKGSKVSPEDPYQFCRNSACPCWGWRTDDSAPAPEAQTAAQEVEQEQPEPAPTAPAPPEGARLLRRRAPHKAGNPPPALPPSVPVDEPKSPVDAARESLRLLVGTQKWDDPKAAAAVGLTLALLSQETGNHEAANVLIDKYDLGRFGIQKWNSQDEVATSTDQS